MQKGIYYAERESFIFKIKSFRKFCYNNELFLKLFIILSYRFLLSQEFPFLMEFVLKSPFFPGE